MDDYLASPLVADPLRKLDICQVTDSAGAVVLVRAERAARPAPHAGAGAGLRRTLRPARDARSAPTTGSTTACSPRWAGWRWQRADLSRADIDLVQIYDAFTIGVLIGARGAGLLRARRERRLRAGRAHRARRRHFR